MKPLLLQLLLVLSATASVHVRHPAARRCRPCFWRQPGPYRPLRARRMGGLLPASSAVRGEEVAGRRDGSARDRGCVGAVALMGLVWCLADTRLRRIGKDVEADAGVEMPGKPRAKSVRNGDVEKVPALDLEERGGCEVALMAAVCGGPWSWWMLVGKDGGSAAGRG